MLAATSPSPSPELLAMRKGLALLPSPLFCVLTVQITSCVVVMTTEPRKPSGTLSARSAVL